MFQKIMSAMRANYTLKKLGINMNIANLEAFALSQGIQILARDESSGTGNVEYNYLMSVTGDAQRTLLGIAITGPSVKD